ncbi:MAG: NAD+ synthase [Chloroflexi bacterium]|nr:NAD+ synthase [Chloroflexota bacterium]
MQKMRIGLAQINSTVGDLDGNTAKILSSIDRAIALKVDLLAFPELAIPGYPPEDLLLKPSFIRDNMERLQRVADHSQDLIVVLGCIDCKEDIFNAAAIIHGGGLVAIYHKQYLPNYGVFDENRYFQAGTGCPIFDIGGVHFGVGICEDIWYPTGPTALQALAGAELIININASPYDYRKADFRRRMLAARASDNQVVIAYVNMVGGQDELVFDGGSMVVDQRGELVVRGRQFEEDLVLADVDLSAVFRSRLHDPRRRKEKLNLEAETGLCQKIVVPVPEVKLPKPPIPVREDRQLEFPGDVYEALVVGTRDYLHKNGFKKAVVGLSGGIDSSLVACIAADALGAENVTGVAMPSRFSSPASKEDAEILATNLGIAFNTISIEQAFQAHLEMLAAVFAGTKPGLAEENLQARIRGNILMGISNKFGNLVLSTGNKSEMAAGYSTLYGDMAGGLAVIKDVPKTWVYRLARYRNGLSNREVIPERVFVKPPSAELRPDQKDEDSLPPYDVLDPILQAYVEEDRSFEEIVNLGYDEQVVKRVFSLVDHSEYKRRQAPPGPKVTPRAFGRDRRLPITDKYRSC